MPFVEILAPPASPQNKAALARSITDGLMSAFGVGAQTITLYFLPIAPGDYAHAAEMGSEGSTQRILLNDGAPQDDSVTNMGANEFAHGHNTVPGMAGGRPQQLHGNTFGGSAIDSQGNASCSAGQDGYIASGNAFTPDPKTYGRTVIDQGRAIRRRHPEFPRLGSTYAHYDRQGHGFGRNRDRVPPGQTFSNVPGGIGVEP
jgi:phenylpyruvate tautomerase PptA (4-oxalocrotonate tautomerase family)